MIISIQPQVLIHKCTVDEALEKLIFIHTHIYMCMYIHIYKYTAAFAKTTLNTENKGLTLPVHMSPSILHGNILESTSQGHLM